MLDAFHSSCNCACIFEHEYKSGGHAPPPPDGYGRCNVHHHTNFVDWVDSLHPVHVCYVNALFQKSLEYSGYAIQFIMIGLIASGLFVLEQGSGLAHWALDLINDAIEICRVYAWYYLYLVACFYHDVLDILYYPLAKHNWEPGEHFTPKWWCKIEDLSNCKAEALCVFLFCTDVTII